MSHPRVSPDGRRLLYTVSDFGTFPIWHREADLRMIDLESGEVDTLDAVNSDMSDTYHSWSSSGRWFVFSSKRDDGLYGKPYFVHVDADGTAGKPFVLPQESPSFYDLNLKSFNVPDLGCQPVSITPVRPPEPSENLCSELFQTHFYRFLPTCKRCDKIVLQIKFLLN